jgi:hypothetical protein
MGRTGWPYAILVVALGGAATVVRPHREAAAQTAAQIPAVAAPRATVGAPEPASGQHGAGRSGGGNFRETALYVDGKARGVLRYSELPPTLKPMAMPEIDDLDIPRYYRVTDYLRATGVDVAAIREIHFYGSHDRVAVVSGDELRAARDKMVFDFTQQVEGKPRARWSQLHALHHKPMVDVILAIAAYVEKPPPECRNGELRLNGKAVEDPIPYVGDGVPKGTRVYVDGKLFGWVRRKALPNSLIARGSDQTHARFSTDAFLAYVGADSRGARAIDFYDGDDLIARVDGASWTTGKTDYVFELPNRSHGQVRQLFPGDKSSAVTSLRLYVHTSPPDRTPDPDAFMERAAGSDDSHVGGGNGDGSGGNNGEQSMAQDVTPSSAEDDQL